MHLVFPPSLSPVLFCFICVSSFLVSQSVYFLFYFKRTFSSASLCFYFPSLFFFILCLFCFLLFNYWQSAVPQCQLRGHHKNFYTERHCVILWWSSGKQGHLTAWMVWVQIWEVWKRKRIFSINYIATSFSACLFRRDERRFFPSHFDQVLALFWQSCKYAFKFSSISATWTNVWPVALYIFSITAN